MKEFLKFVIPVGIFILVMSAGGLLAKAARPDKLVYPTLQEVQQMISDAITPIQSAINSLGQRITALEGSNPTQESKPPFEVVPVFESGGKNINASGGFSAITIKIHATAGNQGKTLPDINYWGVAHTPDGDVVAENNFDSANRTQNWLWFAMPQNYPIDTPIQVDIYASYGGKTGKTTINL